jgi:hypothetical protein
MNKELYEINTQLYLEVFPQALKALIWLESTVKSMHPQLDLPDISNPMTLNHGLTSLFVPKKPNKLQWKCRVLSITKP